MQKFKTLAKSRLVVLIGGMVLALTIAWPLMGTAQDKSVKTKVSDPHAQHKDMQPAEDQDMASQIAELSAKVARLEAALKKRGTGMAGMSDMKPDKGGKKPAMGMMKEDMDEMGSMQPGQGAPAAGGMGGGEMGMKMDKMMGMMEMMMGGSSMQPAGGMGGGEMAMKMDKMMAMMEKKMNGGSMQPAGGMGGGEMSMKMDKMMAMMEKMMNSGPMQPAPAAPAMGGAGVGALELKMEKLLWMMEKMIGSGSMQPAAPAMGGMM